MLLWMRKIVQGTHASASGALKHWGPCRAVNFATLSLTAFAQRDMEEASSKKRKQNGQMTSVHPLKQPVVDSGLSCLHARGKPRPLKAGINNLGNGTTVAFYPRAFAAQDKQLMLLLQEEVPWQQQEITIMGRKVMQPRLVAYMADDPSLSYTYSHAQQTALPWSLTVARIRDKIEQLAGTGFNSCLLNLYESGQHQLGWHSDNERLYGPLPTIGSVSFGSPRDFLLRQNIDHSNKHSVSLGNGDALVMGPGMQRDWQHCVPKRQRVTSSRVSLTFRKIVDVEGQASNAR